MTDTWQWRLWKHCELCNTDQRQASLCTRMLGKDEDVSITHASGQFWLLQLPSSNQIQTRSPHDTSVTAKGLDRHKHEEEMKDHRKESHRVMAGMENK